MLPWDEGPALGRAVLEGIRSGLGIVISLECQRTGLGGAAFLPTASGAQVTISLGVPLSDVDRTSAGASGQDRGSRGDCMRLMDCLESLGFAT